MTWTTKDGRTILISEMSDRHLRNTIKMLLRNAARHVLISVGRLVLLHEDAETAAGRHGVEDVLARAFQVDPARLVEDRYPHLIAEARRRGFTQEDLA